MKAIQMVTVGDVPVAVTAAENAFAVTVRLRCRTRRGRVIAAGFLVRALFRDRDETVQALIQAEQTSLVRRIPFAGNVIEPCSVFSVQM